MSIIFKEKTRILSCESCGNYEEMPISKTRWQSQKFMFLNNLAEPYYKAESAYKCSCGKNVISKVEE